MGDIEGSSTHSASGLSDSIDGQPPARQTNGLKALYNKELSPLKENSLEVDSDVVGDQTTRISPEEHKIENPDNGDGGEILEGNTIYSAIKLIYSIDERKLR